MKHTGNLLARAMNLGLLAGAWLAVPSGARAEWWREWRAELWQARREHECDGRVSLASERTLINFCLGAYQDALCLRRLNRRRSHVYRVRFGAAWQCIAVLAALLVASYSLMHLLPGVRAKQTLSRVATRSGLVLIKSVDNVDSLPTISSGQYRAWKNRKQEFFDGLAFYRITKEDVSWQHLDNSRDRVGWGVARASSNFFTLLGFPVQLVSASTNETEPISNSDIPSLVLSERAWRREFDANPEVVGSQMKLGSVVASIVGVLPEGALGLSGNVDAWLLESDSKIVPGGAGYVIAHLNDSGRSKMQSGSIQITSYAPYRSPDDLLGTSIQREFPTSRAVFLFSVLLALLALPAITSISLAEYTVSTHEISWIRRAYRWSFLVAKIALVLPIVYFGAIDIGYGFTGLDAIYAVYTQLVLSIFGCLFGLSWALTDQLRRCPVCLERVAHPARVGQYSRTFLAWSGTEMMCSGGHTLLHVPSLPTSWFSTQRWMFLDPSWKFLFADPAQD
jgi:hypothetical protein